MVIENTLWKFVFVSSSRKFLFALVSVVVCLSAPDSSPVVSVFQARAEAESKGMQAVPLLPFLLPPAIETHRRDDWLRVSVSTIIQKLSSVFIRKFMGLYGHCPKIDYIK